MNAFDEVEISEPDVPYAAEVEALREIAHDVFSIIRLTPIEKRHIAIGVFNTHFAFLKDGVHAYDSTIEICLFPLRS